MITFLRAMDGHDNSTDITTFAGMDGYDNGMDGMLQRFFLGAYQGLQRFFGAYEWGVSHGDSQRRANIRCTSPNALSLAALLGWEVTVPGPDR